MGGFQNLESGEPVFYVEVWGLLISGGRDYCQYGKCAMLCLFRAFLMRNTQTNPYCSWRASHDSSHKYLGGPRINLDPNVL